MAASLSMVAILCILLISNSSMVMIPKEGAIIPRHLIPRLPCTAAMNTRQDTECITLLPMFRDHHHHHMVTQASMEGSICIQLMVRLQDSHRLLTNTELPLRRFRCKVRMVVIPLHLEDGDTAMACTLRLYPLQHRNTMIGGIHRVILLLVMMETRKVLRVVIP
jgi:hypothetical protein